MVSYIPIKGEPAAEGGIALDELMCHADVHDVRVRLLVLFVLRRLICL
jgi:hypothetical protein